MRTKVLLVVAALLMAIVSTVAIGSNMGFKISIPLKAFSLGSHDGINTVSLPFYNGYADAAAVFSDVPGCVEVDLYDPATQTVRAYDGGFNLDNFQVAPGGELANGQAIFVKVAADANWVVVGSHNPSKTIPLSAFQLGVHDGINFRSVPYHTDKQSASQLFAEIPNVVEIDLYDPSTQTLRAYDGGFNLDDFSLVPGAAIVIKVSSDSNTWVPAHY